MVENEIISVLILATLIGYLFSLAIIAKVRYSSFAKKVREYDQTFRKRLVHFMLAKMEAMITLVNIYLEHLCI